MHELQESWEGFRQGDREAFSHLYRQLYSDLYAYSLKITTSEVIAQDAVQDVFTALWQNRSAQASVHSVRTYLLRSVRNRAIRLLKKQNQGTSLDRVDPLLMQIQPAELRLTDPSEQTKKLVRKALQRLSPQQREVVYLKYYINLDYREIADLLEINYQSAVNHVYRAVKKLRKENVWKYLDTG